MNDERTSAMKGIAIVTDGISRVGTFLKENLNVLFGGHVGIENYYFKDLKDDEKIEEDVVLVMIKERVVKVSNYISENSEIVVINRTIMEKEIYKIFSIPEGTRVLVVNDNRQTTMEAISLFYRLGISHLKLVAYDPSDDYSDLDIAVTLGERENVPTHIENIIDVGHRSVDISTFLEIINKLKLDSEEISQRLIRYSEEIISLESGIKESYREAFVKNEELNAVMNLSRDGIILVSKRGEILVCNDAFLKIFNMEADINGENIENIFTGEMTKILERGDFTNEVVKYKGKYLSVNKSAISHFGKSSGYYYNIQEITYIRQLEQNLSRKLKNMGHIARYSFDDIRTESLKMKSCKSLAKKIATSDLTVLITGESGTGKELIAQSIHNASERKHQPFIAVNCAAMPENLLESELFGYEAGAFTGALKEGKKGFFEQANHGTLFLDEIGDMPVNLQTKLLRVLQERQVIRIGSEKVIDINVRIVAATNRNLLKMIEESKFRQDLYYRVNVLPINVPPLRKRREDILFLTRHFMDCRMQFSSEVEKILKGYDWPGNIRELTNVASYISTMCENDVVEVEDLPFGMVGDTGDFKYESGILEEKNCLLKAVRVLNVIEECNARDQKVGRSRIMKILDGRGVSVTESETRRILSILGELDLIESGIGRSGSRITRRGKNFISEWD